MRLRPLRRLLSQQLRRIVTITASTCTCNANSVLTALDTTCTCNVNPDLPIFANTIIRICSVNIRLRPAHADTTAPVAAAAAGPLLQ